MSQDLAALLTGSPAKPAARKAPTKYEPYEAAVRTIMAEESDPEAQDWVAGVMANRLKSGKYGKDFYEVATAPKQFEPWKRGTAQAVDVNSDAYKKTAERVRDILDGKRDPSGGMTHFYAPEAQAELAKTDGRSPKAEFDDGTGVMKGNTLFFRNPDQNKGSELASILGGDAPEAQPTTDADKAYAEAFGDPSKYEDKADLTGAGLVGYTEGVKGSLDKAQTDVLSTFEKGGYIDRKEPPGSIRNPLWMTGDTSEKDVPPGAYYVSRGKDAMLKRAEGGEEESSAAKGFSRGIGDVMLSVADLMPGTEDSTIRNRMVADQMAYDADLKGDFPSGVARFTGQAIPATLAMAGAEAAAIPAIGGSALGRFVLGKAGTEMAPGIGSAATKLASRITQGAAEGAGGAALVSSASDVPLADQMKSGAIIGGVLRPAVPLATKAGEKVGAMVRDVTEPWTHAGREKGIDRILGQVAPDGINPDLRELVPGSKPTLGEATGNAGIATLERNARTNPQLTERFNERLRDNAAARKDFFGSIAKDGEAITEAKAAREAATASVREEAFKNAKPADPAPVLEKIDEILKGPSGQRDVVTKALTAIREKLAKGTPSAKAGEDAYIGKINPEGKRVAEGERPNLGMGDMFGMAPKGAKQITTLDAEDLGKVRFVEKDGDVYALAHNPDLGEEDVIGYAMNRGDSTELHVVAEAQGKGIGSELSFQYRKRNPDAPSGGLTEGGEASARKAYQRMVKEGVLKAGDAPQGQTDVQQLYGIRKAIGDMLDPLGPSETKGAVLAKRELMEVKEALDKAIEGAAPGFKGYLKTYADMSKPIDEMEYLQSLNLADSKGVITLSKVQSAIDRIEKAQKAGGTNKQKSISKETMDGLKALRDDLKRSGNIDLGKARGSDTIQNAAMGKFTGDMNVPVLGGAMAAHPALGFAVGAGKKALEGKSAKAVDQLASRLLYPEVPVKSVTLKKKPRILPVGEVALPVIGGQFTSSVGANK